MVSPDTRGQRAADQSAKDCHSAMPHLQDLTRVTIRREVSVRHGQHVENACADQTENNRDQSNIENLIKSSSELLPSVRENPHRDNHAREHGDGIHVNGQRPDLKLRESWRRDVGKRVHNKLPQ